MDVKKKRRPGRPAFSNSALNIRRRASRAALAAAGPSVTSYPRRRGRPRVSESARSLQRQQLQDEIQAAQAAVENMASGVPGAAAALATALQTKGGKKIFPELAVPYQSRAEGKQAEVVVKALAGAIGALSNRPPPAPPPPQRDVNTAAGPTVLCETSLKAGESTGTFTEQQHAPRTSLGANNSASKMPLVALIMHHAENELAPAALARHLGLSPAYVRKACSRPRVQLRDGLVPPGVLDLKQSSSRDGSLKTHPIMQEIISDFFTENTSVFSGATRKTRRLLMSRTELLQRFFALLPQMLRAKSVLHPELSHAGRLTKHYTALQANMLAAAWAAEQKDFEEVREAEERLAAAKQHDLDKLVAKRLAVLGIRAASVRKPARATLDRSVGGFDPSSWPVTPPTKETFWKVLELGGVRFTEVSNPTQCPIHDSGPVDEVALAEVVEELAALCKLPVSFASTRRRKVLATEKRSLQKAVDLYHLHLRQYEKQRAKVQQLEADLVPGEGVLYRDYVNDHDENGAKVCNLQLVLVERKVPGGPVVLTNIENFADKEACDACSRRTYSTSTLRPATSTIPGSLTTLRSFTLLATTVPTSLPTTRCSTRAPFFAGTVRLLSASSCVRTMRTTAATRRV
jgi:hypothetical protein